MVEEKEEKKVDKLVEKAEETIQARDDDQKEVKLETPLDEVKRISEETKKIAEMNKETLAKLEEVNANITLAGRADAGRVVRKQTQEEKDQEDADKITNQFNPE